MKGLLEGVRVVEAAVLLTGDYLGMLLADEGADVVKVETPGLGDWIRDHMGEVVPRYSPYHLFVNRNKRSITADLKSPLGRDIVHRLVADADVVVTGFTGTVPERLGIGYEQLRAIKPDLVYCQATGFGADGPYASLPSHGEMMQALVASPRREVGPDGHPMIAKDDQTASPPEGVVVGPLYAAYGVASALFRRERTGEGCYLDVACSDAVLAATYPTALFPLNEGRYSKHAMHPRTEGRVAARYTYYRTKEGKHLLFCPEEPKFWSRFCRAIGRSDLDVVADTAVTTDYGDGDIALYDELQRVFLTRTLDEWVQLFLDHKIPGGPALPVEEAQDDPHIRFRQMIVDEKHPVAGPFTTLGNPIRVPGRDFVIRHPAPALGEHTDEVLREIGYSADELEELRSLGAV
jgi:crotonobetainyl-CoA:carnitine CoA-transferase CaiB-like acyl-CoA transferase